MDDHKALPMMIHLICDAYEAPYPVALLEAARSYLDAEIERFNVPADVSFSWQGADTMDCDLFDSEPDFDDRKATLQP